MPPSLADDALAPFEGLRVLDLSDRLSGAFAARLFGDYGAEVLLAEPPSGHPLRREPPFAGDVAGPDRGAVHAFINWNKQSRIVASPDDAAALIADCDVLVTTAARIDLPPWERGLAGLRADAVHLSITAHGLTGPLAGLAGNNLTACARTGWSTINGYRDEPPLQLPRDQAGYVAGVAGFVAAAAALRRRGHGECAERVDVSELEALALTVHPWGITAIYNDAGATSGPTGVRVRGGTGPLRPCADGRLSLALATVQDWQAAMDLLGLPELGPAGRPADLGQVMAGVARTLPARQRWPLFHGLSKLRCATGVLQPVEELVDDPQLRARGFFVQTAVGGRPVTAPGAPAHTAPGAWRLARSAPALGEGGADFQRRTATPPAGPTRLNQDALAEGPLSGVKVLSFGQAWSGAFGAELLALLGADVVQVGPLTRVDSWRRVARDQIPKGVADASRRQHPLNTNGLYNSVNLNKRELALDLGQPEGRELLWRLFAHYEIVIDNFRSTVLPSWGVTLEALHAVRPGMIWASLSGYGADGPYADYPANGSTIEPMSGLSSLHGYAGDAGFNTGGLFPDPVSGYFLAGAIIAALHRRDRIGGPQRIDLSMMEAVAVVCGDAFTEYGATGRPPRPEGNRHPRIAPHNTYPAQGGEWLAVAAETDEAWAALARCVGDPQLGEVRFATMAARKANEDALDAIIAAWCANQDVAEAAQRLGALGVAAARVAPLYEVYSRPDPLLLQSGFITRVEHPEAGGNWLPGRPWRLSAAAASPLTAAPCVGEHSREVLAQALGIDAVEYAGLVARGVTGTVYDLAAKAHQE
jgi:crotonobetainyl-CoA:carnitine CoA-transferase CaiB-like acyl-CoA transferase